MCEAEKLDGKSRDVAAAKRAELKQLFPSVFTETVGADGTLTEAVDVERLKAELGAFSDLFERRRETENRKIECGEAHFKALDVNFKVATTIAEVLAE